MNIVELHPNWALANGNAAIAERLREYAEWIESEPELCSVICVATPIPGGGATTVRPFGLRTTRAETLGFLVFAQHDFMAGASE